MRYDYVAALAAKYQPETILEVGTWNGRRAVEMLTAAPKARYYGFDLFEEATEETDAAEMNVKKHHSLRGVHSYLLEALGPEREITLIRGNTRKTLAEFNESVDFAWIDGGHSVETIRSDWDNVRRVIKPGGVVLFDDYYSDDIDTSKFGCNSIVKDWDHVVVCAPDPVLGGGTVRIARVYV